MRSRTLLSALGLMAVLMTGCSGSSGGESSATPTLAPLTVPSSSVPPSSAPGPTTPGTVAPTNATAAARAALDTVSVTPSDVCANGRSRFIVSFDAPGNAQLRQITAIVDGEQEALNLPSTSNAFETAEVPCDGRIRSVVVVVTTGDAASVNRAFAVPSVSAPR